MHGPRFTFIKIKGSPGNCYDRINASMYADGQQQFT